MINGMCTRDEEVEGTNKFVSNDKQRDNYNNHMKKTSWEWMRCYPNPKYK